MQVPLVLPGSDRRSIGYKLKILSLYHAPYEEVCCACFINIVLYQKPALSKTVTLFDLCRFCGWIQILFP